MYQYAISISPPMRRLALWISISACTHAPRPPAGDVIFVCEHGAAKSVIASEYFNKLAAERGLAVRSVARGADPQAALSVSAVKGLQADGLPPQLAAPRPLAARLRGLRARARRDPHARRGDGRRPARGAADVGLAAATQRARA